VDRRDLDAELVGAGVLELPALALGQYGRAARSDLKPPNQIHDGRLVLALHVRPRRSSPRLSEQLEPLARHVDGARLRDELPLAAQEPDRLQSPHSRISALNRHAEPLPHRRRRHEPEPSDPGQDLDIPARLVDLPRAPAHHTRIDRPHLLPDPHRARPSTT